MSSEERMGKDVYTNLFEVACTRWEDSRMFQLVFVRYPALRSSIPVRSCFVTSRASCWRNDLASGLKEPVQGSSSARTVLMRAARRRLIVPFPERRRHPENTALDFETR
jgi:hypothetical protein